MATLVRQITPYIAANGITVKAPWSNTSSPDFTPFWERTGNTFTRWTPPQRQMHYANPNIYCVVTQEEFRNYFETARCNAFNNQTDMNTIAYILDDNRIIVVKISNIITTYVTNIRQTFLNIKGQIADISSWDTSKVTSMASLFLNSSFNGNIEYWTTSNVTSMSAMFENTSFNGDLSRWDVKNVTYASGMFRNSKFNGNITTWRPQVLRDQERMFENAVNFNQNLTSWYYSFEPFSVNCNKMFNGATRMDPTYKRNYLNQICIHNFLSDASYLWQQYNLLEPDAKKLCEHIDCIHERMPELFNRPVFSPFQNNERITDDFRELKYALGAATRDANNWYIAEHGYMCDELLIAYDSIKETLNDIISGHSIETITVRIPERIRESYERREQSHTNTPTQENIQTMPNHISADDGSPINIDRSENKTTNDPTYEHEDISLDIMNKTFNFKDQITQIEYNETPYEFLGRDEMSNTALIVYGPSYNQLFPLNMQLLDNLRGNYDCDPLKYNRPDVKILYGRKIGLPFGAILATALYNNENYVQIFALVKRSTPFYTSEMTREGLRSEYYASKYELVPVIN